METFAEYILNEKNLASKMEIMYYLARKSKIFFDKSTVFKTEIARLFVGSVPLEIDQNQVLTACLLCNCKKVEISQNLDELKSYAKHGAEYLFSIGFDKKFCKICEEVNRYSNSQPREKEGDILELVDQFGGMLLDRPERIGLSVEEALVLLEYRNLKDCFNRYLHPFIDFVREIESIIVSEEGEITPLQELIKLFRETPDEKHFITAVTYEYEPKIDKILRQTGSVDPTKNEGMLEEGNPNRALFSEETTKKIIGHLVP